jgi:pimeloyl-ACP methyl ester carboxylesterase
LLEPILRDLPIAATSERRPAVPTPAQVFTFLIHPRRSAPTPDDQAALAGAERIDVRHRGTKLAVWSWGHGLPVLLLHGWESQASHMAGFVGPLVQAGLRVLAMDAPGHGHSEGTTTEAVDYGRAVVSVVNALGSFAFIGHSVGSAAALYAFSQGAWAHASAHLAGPSSMERVVRRSAAAAGLDDAGAQQVLERMAGQIGEPLEIMDVHRLQAGFRHRALILHDPDDRAMPYAESVALSKAWQGSTLEPVAGVGHRRIVQEPSVVEVVVRFVMDARAGTKHPIRVAWR